MPLTTRLKRPTVLIVDAAADRRERVLGALAPHEFRPRAVADAKEAALALQRVETDIVVVSDDRAAGVLRVLRPLGPRVRFVVIAQASWDAYTELTSLGAIEVVPPALVGPELAKRLRRLMPSDAA